MKASTTWDRIKAEIISKPAPISHAYSRVSTGPSSWSSTWGSTWGSTSTTTWKPIPHPTDSFGQVYERGDLRGMYVGDDPQWPNRIYILHLGNISAMSSVLRSDWSPVD